MQLAVARRRAVLRVVYRPQKTLHLPLAHRPHHVVPQPDVHPARAFRNGGKQKTLHQVRRLQRLAPTVQGFKDNVRAHRIAGHNAGERQMLPRPARHKVRRPLRVHPGKQAGEKREGAIHFFLTVVVRLRRKSPHQQPPKCVVVPAAAFHILPQSQLQVGIFSQVAAVQQKIFRHAGRPPVRFGLQLVNASQRHQRKRSQPLLTVNDVKAGILPLLQHHRAHKMFVVTGDVVPQRLAVLALPVIFALKPRNAKARFSRQHVLQIARINPQLAHAFASPSNTPRPSRPAEAGGGI